MLIGGNGSRGRYDFAGDAASMNGFAEGGDDLLIAGDKGATLYGYIRYGMYGHAQGGDDTLISGAGNDVMWGEGDNMAETATGGADTFAFLPNSGFDAIWDFRQSDGDLIDVSAYGYTDVSDLNISQHGYFTRVDLRDGNTILLRYSGDAFVLTNEDFIFA